MAETDDQNILITLADVDVVRQVNPEFNQMLFAAAISRMRVENTYRMEFEATEKKSDS
tara:strand:+ start:334 stop:507 length:174 start_codon:yes stop_codon:yes gene_type:complete